MKNRIRRAAVRFPKTNVPTKRRHADLATTRATLAQLFHGDMPTVNNGDSKHFESVDVVTIAIPRADLVTIGAALLHIAAPNTLDLANRLPSMRLRVKGALQDQQN